nr:RNA-directed DNA polymerase, eukaryota [Tanacetum cinerariifolium]
MSDRNFHNSYENQTQKISKSVFVTNFPEDSTARDLWKVCSDYGMVVDVFIPFKRSKLGFQNVKLSYLGGMWVLFEFDSLASKEKFLNHSCIGSLSLFKRPTLLKMMKGSFGFPLRVFLSKLGLLTLFVRFHLYGKVIIQGKVYWIRVKKLDAWFPNFQEDDQDDLSSDEESQEGDVANKANNNNKSDAGRVSESSFMHENNTAHKDVNSCKKREVRSHLEDPFNIYGILDGKKNNVCNSCSDEPKFPPVSTPYKNDQEKNVEENIKDTTERVQSLSNKLNGRCSNCGFSSQRSMNYHSQKSKDYLRTFIDRWEGDTVIMGDFNEVRSKHERKINIQQNLSEVDKLIDQGKRNDEILIKRITLLNDLQEPNNRNAMEISQKAKIRWFIEGDKNSKYFHGIMNKKRSQLAIRGNLANEEWISEPHRVKNEFFTHFKKQFLPIQAPSICFDFTFPIRLSSDQVQYLKRTVTYEEVKRAVWDCGTNKSPGQMDFPVNFTNGIIGSVVVLITPWDRCSLTVALLWSSNSIKA